MPQNIANRPFQTAWDHHYSTTYFNQNIAVRILGAGGITWQGASAQQSCAMRMSIALAYSGVTWRPRETTNVWRLQGTNVYFPSLASDYPNVPLLANREAINSAADISNRGGVVFFGGGFASASGHLTLWDGTDCHFNDAYWDQPNKFFWGMT